MRIHAIILALNEDVFVENQLRYLYAYCSGISVLTQYDRDWYGKGVEPDKTITRVAQFPDPEGKIHLVLRRWRDQAAALNCEMLALTSRPSHGVLSHGSPIEEVHRFHAKPDYFWIIDADEFYDEETIPAMLALLAKHRPKGMRVHGFSYVKTWNRRVREEAVEFCQFGFVRSDVKFTSIRQVTWNEPRLQKLLRIFRLPDCSASVFGFIQCPKQTAMFHHGCWLGDRERLRAKAEKSAHVWVNTDDFPETVAEYPYCKVATNVLPASIRDGNWPPDYFDERPID